MSGSDPIAWVFFDMDGTLCDVDAAVAGGLGAVNDGLAHLMGGSASLPTVLEYQRAWEADADAQLASGVSHEEIRRGSVRRVLRRHGIDATTAELDALLEQYFRVRFQSTRAFPEVPVALTQVKAGHRVGIISNGNSYAERIGLGGYFDAEFYGQRIGLRKPDPQVFRFVAGSLGLDPASCLMVGDSLTGDVRAPISVGWSAIHVDRTGSGSEAAVSVRDIDGVVD